MVWARCWSIASRAHKYDLHSSIGLVPHSLTLAQDSTPGGVSAEGVTLQAGHNTAADVLVASLGSKCDGHEHLLDTFQLCIPLFFTLCDAPFPVQPKKGQIARWV